MHTFIYYFKFLTLYIPIHILYIIQVSLETTSEYKNSPLNYNNIIYNFVMLHSEPYYITYNLPYLVNLHYIYNNPE